MKKEVFLTIFFLSLQFFCFAQTPLKYEKVVHLDSTVSKQELYNRAKRWFVDNFRSAKNVIQLEDAEAGEIIGKPSFSYESDVFVGHGATIGTITYSVKLQVKDGRYKYIISDFVHKSTVPTDYAKSFGLIYDDYFDGAGFVGGKKTDNKIWNELIKDCDKEAKELIATLIPFMEKPAESGNDW